MQSASDISRGATAFVPVCADTARTAERKTEATPKLFMVRHVAAFAAIRQTQDARNYTKVTNWLISTSPRFISPPPARSQFSR
jgi:hypothetical protein